MHVRDMSWMGGAPCTHKRPFSVSNPPSFFFISDTDADSDGVNSNGMVLDEALPKQQHGDCERHHRVSQHRQSVSQLVAANRNLQKTTIVSNRNSKIGFGAVVCTIDGAGWCSRVGAHRCPRAALSAR